MPTPLQALTTIPNGPRTGILLQCNLATMFKGYVMVVEFLCEGVLKRGQSRPFLIYFRLFKHTLQFFQKINMKKCPSNIRCQDLNSRPLEY